MKRETIHNIIITMLSILIVAGILYGGYYLIIGRNGLVNKINTAENEFDKTEVMEAFKELVKEKYMEVYKNPETKLEEAYNPDVAIAYFFEKGVIDYYYYSNYDEASNKYTYVSNEDVVEETRKKR